MRAIRGELTPDLAKIIGNKEPAKAEAIRVQSYRELMQHVAQLSYENKDHMLFFRGQGSDHKNKAGASSFYPSIYRGERLSREELSIRFDVLHSTSKRLIDSFDREGIPGSKEVRRRQYIRWSILQHYEVCPTPLLDFTHSLRVACSFATQNAKDLEGYVYVFGFPYLTNRISVNSEEDLVNVRLLSICPPDALRPYFQEGYLAGTDEVTVDYDSKDELDFTRRFIAKFMIPARRSFWSGGGAAIPKPALFPTSDRILELCNGIRDEVTSDVKAGQIGRFLQSWAELEGRLVSLARESRQRVFSVREAMDVLVRDGMLSMEEVKRIDALRRTRNTAVHRPFALEPGQLTAASFEIESLQPDIQALTRTKRTS